MNKLNYIEWEKKVDKIVTDYINSKDIYILVKNKKSSEVLFNFIKIKENTDKIKIIQNINADNDRILDILLTGKTEKINDNEKEQDIYYETIYDDLEDYISDIFINDMIEINKDNLKEISDKNDSYFYDDILTMTQEWVEQILLNYNKENIINMIK